MRASPPPAPSTELKMPIPPEHQHRFLEATHAAGLGIKDILFLLDKKGADLIQYMKIALAPYLERTDDEPSQASKNLTDKPIITIEEQQQLVDQVRQLGITLRHVFLLLKYYPSYMKKFVVDLREKERIGIAETNLAQPVSPIALSHLYNLKIHIERHGVQLDVGSRKAPPITATPLTFEELNALMKSERIKRRGGQNLEKGVVEINTKKETRMQVEFKDKAGQMHTFTMVNSDKGLIIELREGEEKLFQ